ncbi:MAG: hypothetical protein WCC10_09420, partial [Tumebacillaceae bacterium]
MRIKPGRVLLFTILCVGLSVGREGVVRASPYTFPATAKAIDVSGDKMVYMKTANNDWDVYLYNLS